MVAEIEMTGEISEAPEATGEKSLSERLRGVFTPPGDFGRPLGDGLEQVRVWVDASRQKAEDDLYILKKQEAKYGIDVPVKLANDIEDAQYRIRGAEDNGGVVQRLQAAVEAVSKEATENEIVIGSFRALAGNAPKALRTFDTQMASQSERDLYHKLALATKAVVAPVQNLAGRDESRAIFRGLSTVSRDLIQHSFGDSGAYVGFVRKIGSSTLPDSDKVFLLAASAEGFLDVLLKEAAQAKDADLSGRVEKIIEQVNGAWSKGEEKLPSRVPLRAGGTAPSPVVEAPRAPRGAESAESSSLLPKTPSEVAAMDAAALLDALDSSLRYPQAYQREGGEEALLQGRRLIAQELFINRGLDLPLIITTAHTRRQEETTGLGQLGYKDCAGGQKPLPCKNAKEFTAMLQKRYKNVYNKTGDRTRVSIYVAFQKLGGLITDERMSFDEQTEEACKTIMELSGDDKEFLEGMLVGAGRFEVLAARGSELLT